MGKLSLNRVLLSIFLLLATFLGTSAPTDAQTIVSTIGVGTGPASVAVNPTTNRVYVTNQRSNTVSVIDGASNAVVVTIPVGAGPLFLDVNPTTNRVYVTNSFGNSVSVVDGASNSVIATIPVGRQPTRVLVDSATNRIYVANFMTDNVSVIDGTANAVVATVAVGFRPTALALNPSTNRIYVANTNGGSVSVIDGSSNAVLATIPVGTSPQALAVNPTTNRIYAANNGSNNVSVIDGAANAVVATIPAGVQPLSVVANPATNRIYVANFNGNSVSAIDGSTNTVVATIPVGRGATFIALEPTSNHVYTANQLDNSVTAIDGATNTVVATLGVGASPGSLGVNAATNRVYVVNSGSNNVSVIQDVTPPPPPFTPVVSWFFAEGSSQPPFQTWFLVQNPTSSPATVRFTFEIQGGGMVTRDFHVGPTSRFSLFTNQVIPGVAFSTRIDSDQMVLTERSMFVNFDGDVVAGIAAPNRTWLFAEGSTQSPFQTWFLLQNPSNVPATATITYLRPGGGATAIQTLALPPTSRTSVFVNLVLPNAAFSTRVDSDQPIVVERAMYRFPGNAATADAGVNAPSTTWFFPNALTSNGTTGAFPTPFDAWLLLQNPNAATVTATVKLDQTNGTIATFTQTLAPNSRQSVFLNQVQLNASFGIEVDASAPITAERSLFFGTEPRGAMAEFGAPAPATSWFLAEGSTQPPFTEQIFILNPNPTTMSVHVDFDLPGGQVVGRDFTIAPTRPLMLDVNQIVPNTPVSAHVTTSLPSVVERQMFFTKFGSLGGTDAIGITRP